jgi:hypothetical protein
VESTGGSPTGLRRLAGFQPPTINGNPTMRRRASWEAVGRRLSPVGALNAVSDCGGNLRSASPSKSTASDGTRDSDPPRSSSNRLNVSKMWLMLTQFRGSRCARISIACGVFQRDHSIKNGLRRSRRIIWGDSQSTSTVPHVKKNVRRKGRAAMRQGILETHPRLPPADPARTQQFKKSIIPQYVRIRVSENSPQLAGFAK